MRPDNNPSSKPSWLKDILNGFLAWLIAFLLYMLPALVVGISMGFDLGPKLKDNAEVSRRISQAIGEMYKSSWYLHIGFIVVLAILVFWRAWARTRHTVKKSNLHGATIGTAAAILVILQMMPMGAGIYAIIPAVVCVMAGFIGGQKRGLQHTSQ